MTASPRRFVFEDFAPTEPAPTPAAPPPDLEALRAEAAAEARSLAFQSIAAAEAAALQRIAATLETAHRDVAAQQADLNARADAIAKTFLEEFCGDLLARSAIPIAADFLRRLVDGSDDRRGARLALAPLAHDRLRPRLETLIAERGLTGFVTIERDAALGADDVALRWRGGDLRRGRTEIAAAVAGAFEAISAVERTADHGS